MAIVVRFREGFQSVDPSSGDSLSALAARLDGMGLKFLVSAGGDALTARGLLDAMATPGFALDKNDVIALLDDIVEDRKQNRNQVVNLFTGNIPTTFGLRDGRDDNYSTYVRDLLKLPEGASPVLAFAAKRAPVPELPPGAARTAQPEALRVVAYPASLAVLNEVQAGRATLGSDGDSQARLVVMRYLQAHGYTHLTGSNIKLAGFKTAVSKFQSDNALPPTGVVDQHTLQMLLQALPADSDPFQPGPMHPRFILESALQERFPNTVIKASLDRPTVKDKTDLAWKATRPWTPELIAASKVFADAYERQFFDTAERADCFDLYLEANMRFAQLNGLPFRIKNAAGKVFTHKTPSPITMAKRYCAAADLRIAGNSVAIPVHKAGNGAVASMDWMQSQSEPNIRANHTYIATQLDPQQVGRTVVLYASLTKTMRSGPLAQFRQRYGTTLNADAIPEKLIDVLTNYENRGSNWTREQKREWVGRLLDQYGVKPSLREAAIDAFIAAIVKKSSTGAFVNVNMAAPTPVYQLLGEQAFSAITTRDLWTDPSLTNAELEVFNAQHLAGKPRLLKADLLPMVRAASEDEALAQAAALVRSKGVSESSVAEVAAALLALTREARALRELDYERYNRML